MNYLPHVTCILLIVISASFISSQPDDLSGSLCSGCRMRNGKGYNNDPANCFNFVQCHFNRGGFGEAERIPCSLGQFWNQTIGTCMPSSAVHCEQDRCLSGITGYSANGSCRAYWRCENDRTKGISCCTPGSRYIEGVGCQTDSSCTDVCPPVHVIDNTTCHYEPDPLNLRKYKYIRQGTKLTLCCPRGLAFVKETCGCTKAVPIRVIDWCQPSVRIEFQQGVYDSSLDEISITNNLKRVKWRQDTSSTDGWVGNFAVPGSRLIMPRFSNTPFGAEFKIFLRFKEHPGPYTGPEILISNADCGGEPTVQLSFDRRTNLVTFKVRASDREYSLSVGYINGAWKDVVIFLEQGTMWMSIDNRNDATEVLLAEQASMRVYGNIDVSKCALNLGWGEKGVGFRGVIDAFRVYLCVS